MESDEQHEKYDGLIKLSFFGDIGKTITSARTTSELIRAVMEKIGTIYAPASWSLLLRNSKSGELTFVIATGSGAEQLQGKTLSRGQGVAGWIAEHGEPVIVEDVTKDSRFDSAMDQTSGFVTKSIIGVPLKTRTRVFGVIELINRLNGELFTSFDLKLLSTIADYAAIAMEKLYYIQALKKSATTDPLTKLYNRRLLMPFVQREIERSKREGLPFSLLFIDVDRFKNVNDTWGHDTGDEVLRRIADILKSAIRKVDFICRWGGDEFVIVLPSLAKDAVLPIKERILRNPVYSELTVSYGIGLSIGVHEAQHDNAEEIIKSVDRNMYEDKMSTIENEPEDMPTALEDAISGQ
ncbi:MAG: sensor domain-containing diguanylate cyclase [Treponemataceae bacterium]